MKGIRTVRVVGRMGAIRRGMQQMMTATTRVDEADDGRLERTRGNVERRRSSKRRRSDQ